MKLIQVSKLTQEAFAPYGQVLSVEGREAGGNPATHFWYPQAVVIDAPTSINLMKVIPHEFILKDFEAHDYTTENLIAMDGDLIVGVAAVWHAVPFAVGKEVMSVCIFKNNTSHDDIYFASVPEEIGLRL